MRVIAIYSAYECCQPHRHPAFCADKRGICLRNQTIELLRIAAAFGIVVFHAGAPGAEIGYSGLIAFMVMTTMFEAEANHPRSIGSLARRLLLPWAFWSVVYVAARWAISGRAFHEHMSPIQSVLYGDHLWFLPFAFVVLAAIGFVKRFDGPLAPIAAATAVVLMLLAEPLRDVTSVAPIAQWMHIAPAVFIGIAATSIAPATVVAIALVYMFTRQISGVSVPYAVGAGAVLIARYLPSIRINVEPVSRCMFGVYLVHLLALGVVNRITGKGTLLTATIAFLGALAFVAIARRFARPILG